MTLTFFVLIYNVHIVHIFIKKIDQLGKRLTNDRFVQQMGIALVAHSPLKRARQTSHGMLQSVTPSSTTQDINVDSSYLGSKHPSVQRVIELEMLLERTPKEWLPTYYSEYAKRIHSFEVWLSEQPEEVIAIVGHSQYFRSMLGLKSKFNNVDVWSLEFDPSSVEIGISNDNIKVDDDDDDGDNDDNDTKEESSVNTAGGGNGIVTEIDSKPLEGLNLPRGWRNLKHHYRFDAAYSE